ncbi:nicotinate-nucleotide adenylyltransferase [Stappia sp. ES.058]|uniref:nicotinate-nucleotide adenylyltransferase n=1 Tax=Stappia sp. ES.058 TaxID=1881061 RepID=UPI000879DE62|nr:nicotinate-nucleotide adenylyltransferase [Stappia sp. ES.058]SDU47901.1 nicotinate-nucleotide adenylyltransferase [Stappia sp. ES.058]
MTDSFASAVAVRHLRIPHTEPECTVGLFGGSFNPPHSGHRLVADTALKRLALDQIWWLVTPGNPLKDPGELEPLTDRIARVEEVADHPRMRVTALEAGLGTSYSARTILNLRQKRPRVRFVWVMGADNLAGFHRWQAWRSIFESVPVAVVDRPGATLSALWSPAAQTFARSRLPEERAIRLATLAPPAWTFLHAPRDPMSSTHLRATARPW